MGFRRPDEEAEAGLYRRVGARVLDRAPLTTHALVEYERGLQEEIVRHCYLYHAPGLLVLLLVLAHARMYCMHAHT